MNEHKRQNLQHLSKNYQLLERLRRPIPILDFFIPTIYLAKNLRKNLTLNAHKNSPTLLHKSTPTYPQAFHTRLYLSTEGR